MIPAEDPRPQVGATVHYYEGGRGHIGTVRRYRRGDGSLTFPVEDNRAPHAVSDLMVGDPRLISIGE